MPTLCQPAGDKALYLHGLTFTYTNLGLENCLTVPAVTKTRWQEMTMTTAPAHCLTGTASSAAP
jgi:hypothetical protein